MDKEACRKLMEDVKANLKRLNECEGPHEFKDMPDRPYNRKYKCVKCGGTIDGSKYHWYIKGLEHGRL